jgi:hypothetical protein
MAPSKSGRCCRSVPRCRACPVWRVVDVVALEELVHSDEDVAPHLAGVPRCLHKYGPLLDEAAARRSEGTEAERPAAA